MYTSKPGPSDASSLRSAPSCSISIGLGGGGPASSTFSKGKLSTGNPAVGAARPARIVDSPTSPVRVKSFSRPVSRMSALMSKVRMPACANAMARLAAR
ncbi:Uncharacterised protein [Mycobacteroides abscessus subsp. abscessus]|nr:Uncharacterised protein [Mycobacteroides abscessus subsp. abscessus]